MSWPPLPPPSVDRRDGARDALPLDVRAMIMRGSQPPAMAPPLMAARDGVTGEPAGSRRRAPQALYVARTS